MMCYTKYNNNNNSNNNNNNISNNSIDLISWGLIDIHLQQTNAKKIN